MEHKFETLDDYIKFYEGIPKDKWCIEKLHNNQGQSCALGHLQKAGRYNLRDDNKGYSNPLQRKLYEFIAHTKVGFGLDIPTVNDMNSIGYLQDHPKDRIIAFLKDVQQECFANHTPLDIKEI